MYNLSNLSILDIYAKQVLMSTKSISSTEAQNNFGRVLDDVTHHQARYVIQRRGVPQAIVLSFDDFERLLTDKRERDQISTIIKEIRPEYHLGEVLEPAAKSK
jgi:prevent-host-death family protein